MNVTCDLKADTQSFEDIVLTKKKEFFKREFQFYAAGIVPVVVGVGIQGELQPVVAFLGCYRDNAPRVLVFAGIQGLLEASGSVGLGVKWIEVVGAQGKRPCLPFCKVERFYLRSVGIRDSVCPVSTLAFRTSTVAKILRTFQIPASQQLLCQTFRGDALVVVNINLPRTDRNKMKDSRMFCSWAVSMGSTDTDFTSNER